MNNIELKDDYYDHYWSNVGDLSWTETERIKQTIALIPGDCSSVLDVGCGDGRITNCLLSHQYKCVVGLDQSSKALQYVKAEKILGSVDKLPFSDRSFDVVLCCELLEHLPSEVYPSAVEEIERVAKKYIAITVPNNEALKRTFVTCPYCGCSFHAWRHLRSFDRESLTSLCNTFQMETIRAYRPSLKIYPLLTLIVKVARFFKLVSARGFPADALCPQCGYSSTGKASSANLTKERSRFSFLIPPAQVVAINKKSRGWLLVLYKRISG